MISDMFKFLKRHISKWIMPGPLPVREVKGITLLSKEEYLDAKDIVPKLDSCWWLRSPGYNSFDAACVIHGGVVGEGGSHVDVRAVSVRPVLQLNPESVNPKIGNKFRLAEYTWTVIPGNMALCDSSIGEHGFREDWRAPDANDYEASDVKSWLEAWALKKGLTTPQKPEKKLTKERKRHYQ